MHSEDCIANLLPLLLEVVLRNPVRFIGFQIEPMLFYMRTGPNADWFLRDAYDRQCPVKLKPD
jgi:hypothetical protein